MSNMLAATVVVDAARREASDAEISSSDEWSFSKAFKGGGGASSSSSCATVDCKPNVVLPISDDVHRFGFTLLPSLSCHSPTVLSATERGSSNQVGGWPVRPSESPYFHSREIVTHCKMRHSGRFL